MVVIKVFDCKFCKLLTPIENLWELVNQQRCRTKHKHKHEHEVAIAPEESMVVQSPASHRKSSQLQSTVHIPSNPSSIICWTMRFVLMSEGWTPIGIRRCLW